MEFQTFVTEAGTHSAGFRTLIPYILYKYSCDNIMWTAAVPLQLIVLKAARGRASCMHVDNWKRRCWRIDTASHPKRLESSTAPCENLKSCSDIPTYAVLWDIFWHIIQPSFILSYHRRAKWQHEKVRIIFTILMWIFVKFLTHYYVQMTSLLFLTQKTTCKRQFIYYIVYPKSTIWK
jgi:hypothetical protein